MIRRFFLPPQHSMKDTYIWTVIGGLVYAGSSFLMSMVTSNYLGAAVAGILALALSVGSQLVTIGYFNVRTFQASDVTEKYSFGDYLVLRCVTILAMFLVGAVWILRDGYTGAKLTAILVAIVFRATEAVSDLLEGRYQQKGRYDVSCKGVFIKTTLYLAGFLAVLLVSRSLLAALATMAVIYILTIVVIDSQLIGEFGGLSFRSSWKHQKKLLMDCTPLFVNAFLNAYIINNSKYVIDRYYDSEILGIYNALYMMAFVVNMFASFVLKPMISVLAEKYAKKDNAGFLKLVLRQVGVILCVTVVCIVGAYLVGVPVLSFLFGVDLSAHRGALCLMLVSGGFTALYQLFQYGIIIMRHQYSTFVCCAATAAASWIFTPMLVKQGGILGATFSYNLSIGMMSVMFLGFFVYYFTRGKRE